MAKKITMACMALVALAAFALPATASAVNDPQVTEPTGTLLVPEPPEKESPKILATQVGATTKLLDTENKNVELECTSATITGWLTKNKEGSVEGEISTAKFGGTGTHSSSEPETVGNECTATSFFTVNTSVTPEVSTTEPWCLKSLPAYANDEFRIGSGKCGAGSGEGKISFVLAPTGLSTCTYQSTGVLKGTATTDTTGDAILSISPSNPSGVGNGFKKTAGGFLCPESGQLSMSFTLETDEATAKPLFIS
jgi:hypothetical protein